MNAIKAEELDLFCLLEGDKFIVTLMLAGKVVSTFEYGILELAEEYVGSMSGPEGIEGEDAEEAYVLIDALEEAAQYINDAIGDE
jgi:hypothetical protein